MDPHMLMIQQKINSLSLNEDERQDMWVLYLENPNVDLDKNLNNIRILNEEDNAVLDNILSFLQSPPTQDMLDILSIFSELEKSVLILLILGIPKDYISKYKTIEMLRLKQLINNISTHPVWETYIDKKEIKS